MAKTTVYGVWCQVTGGLTGHREAWLKQASGKYRLFDTLAEAEAEALAQTARKKYSPAVFTYTAQPWSP